MNDGLAFPFINLAIAMTLYGAAQNWMVSWLVMDVIYQIVIGVVCGVLLGHLFARFILSIEATTDLAKAVLGLASLATTLVIYGVTEFVGAYGFLAVFVGALTIRHHERDHHYHRSLHQFSEMAERLMSALLLIGFGAAIVTGIFDPLTWELAVLASVIVLVVRPIAGAIAMIGFTRIPWRERWAISLLGVRGIGSFYYLAYALNHGEFQEEKELWAVGGTSRIDIDHCSWWCGYTDHQAA